MAKQTSEQIVQDSTTGALVASVIDSVAFF